MPHSPTPSAPRFGSAVVLHGFDARATGPTRTEVQAYLADGEHEIPITFTIEADGGAVEVDTADGLFPVALLYAMQRGRDLHVEAPLSPRLVYGANLHLATILTRIIPDLHPSRVTASAMVEMPARPGRGVVTGCSGGVDSFNVLQDHLFQSTPPGFAVTHLLFNSVGSHPVDDHDRVFRVRLDRVRRLATAIGLPLIVTTSNQDEVLGNPSFQVFDAVRNATVPLLLQTVARRAYYAASSTYAEVGVYRHGAADIADPLVLPMLSTERMDLVSVGCDLSRMEKIARLPQIPFTREFLDICTYSPDHVVNCGRCLNKCAPTIASMEMLGILDQYAPLFDLDAYREAKNRFLVHMLNTKLITTGNVREEMRKRGIAVPLSLRAIAWAERKFRLRERLGPEIGRKVVRWIGPR